MPKLSKSDFKDILKECLGEILSKPYLKSVLKECLKESLEEEGMSSLNEARQPRARRRPAASDLRLSEQEETDAPNEHLMEHVNSLANSLGRSGKDSKMYAEIFADTAMTTLPTLNGPDSSLTPGYDTKEKVNEESLQGLARGGDMTHWAKLAFAKKD